MFNLPHLWAFLITSPLFYLTLTLVVYGLFDAVCKRMGGNPLANPVLLSIIVIVSFLLVTGTSYQAYFSGAQFIHFLLGPATVALAIPMYKAYEHIRRSASAIMVALVGGALMAIVSAVGIGFLMGGSTEMLLSLSPKSVTTPIAMGIAEEIGGIPSLTAVFVIITGILGAVSSTWVLNISRVHDVRARGFATGLVAHGIGTAHKLRVNELSGAFSGLAMCLNGLATAILLPILVHWFKP